MDSNKLVEENIVDKYGSKRVHVEKSCLYCLNLFWTRKDWVLKGKGLYCSSNCKNKAKRQSRIIITCARCGKQCERLPRRVKPNKSGFFFCSNNCKNKSQCVGGLIQPSHYKQKSNKNDTCLNCKKVLNPSAESFCTTLCRKTYKYNIYIEKWKKGEVTGNSSNGEGLFHYVRKYMLEKVEYKCQKCNWAKVNSKTNKIPLTINHIDGHYENSVESNLEVLCPNCHSLTPNYGSLNKGNGRRKRLLRLYKKQIENTQILDLNCNLFDLCCC